MTTKKNRYERQIQLQEIGIEGQTKISNAKILVIGAGGLGCPALQYLAAAGVGTIGIVDFDLIELSNLQRQILYSVDDIGKFKVNIAAKKLKALNPEIQINEHCVQISNKNALDIINNYDIVIDGSDNFMTRYIVNDACVILNKPLIYGAVLRFEGQVGVFNFQQNKTDFKCNYRDLFPKPPSPDSAISCKEVGVLGVIPGIIGTLQATEALKICSGIGISLANKIISYNALQNSFYEFEISPNPKAINYPKTKEEFLNFDYDYFCNSNPNIIAVKDFNLLNSTEKITIIDVREIGELPSINEFESLKFPLQEFESKVSEIPFQNKIVVFCKSGIRSAKAVQNLKNIYPNCTVFSLDGGIENWIKSK